MCRPPSPGRGEPGRCGRGSPAAPPAPCRASSGPRRRSGAAARPVRRRPPARLRGIVEPGQVEALDALRGHRTQVEPERRPPRQPGVEEVDREVARDAAVGEPAAPVARRTRVARRRVERDAGEQHRHAEAHAQRHDDGQPLGRQRPQALLVDRAGNAVHVVAHAAREECLQLVRVVPVVSASAFASGSRSGRAEASSVVIMASSMPAFPRRRK